MGREIFSNLLERRPLDQVAPVIPLSLDEDYRSKDAIWKQAIAALEQLETRFEKDKLSISTVRYAELRDEIEHQKTVVEAAHGEMSRALSLLEAQQFTQNRQWELDQKRQQLETLGSQIASCDAEISALLDQERRLPARRLQIQGRRSDLWRVYAGLQEEIRRSENAHS